MDKIIVGELRYNSMKEVRDVIDDIYDIFEKKANEIPIDDGLTFAHDGAVLKIAIWYEYPTQK